MKFSLILIYEDNKPSESRFFNFKGTSNDKYDKNDNKSGFNRRI